jgi:hypothetical protein
MIPISRVPKVGIESLKSSGSDLLILSEVLVPRLWEDNLYAWRKLVLMNRCLALLAAVSHR